MVEALCTVVEKQTHETLAVARFISPSGDEVTIVDNQSWLCIHGYVVQKWKRIPLLLCLLHLIDGCGVDNLTVVILEAVLHRGGLTEAELGEKMVSFGADGHPNFQGCLTSVSTQLKKGYAPYHIFVHCVAHRTHLTARTLSNLPIMSKLEDLVKRAHDYFAHSPKRHLELTHLATLLETEGRKLVKNVK